MKLFNFVGIFSFVFGTEQIEYQKVFLEDPKIVLGNQRPEGSRVNVELLETNKAWIWPPIYWSQYQ